MPAIKNVRVSSTYAHNAAASAALNENNDCAVKAVAAACCVSYEDAHQVLKKLGRVDRQGTYYRTIRQAVRFFGFDMIEEIKAERIAQYPGVHKNLQNITTHHPDRFPKVWSEGTYLFYTTGFKHVLCVKDGVNHDWTRGSAKRVEAVFRIVKK